MRKKGLMLNTTFLRVILEIRQFVPFAILTDKKGKKAVFGKPYFVS